ncbi:hypothetical protein PRIC2_009019 [Phytophthora ramorum]
MNWAISEEAQTTVVSSSVRTDINTNKPWDIPEANMAAFPVFMEDRAKVEQWKQTFALYFGEAKAFLVTRINNGERKSDINEPSVALFDVFFLQLKSVSQRFPSQVDQVDRVRTASG